MHGVNMYEHTPNSNDSSVTVQFASMAWIALKSAKRRTPNCSDTDWLDWSDRRTLYFLDLVEVCFVV